MTLETLYQLAPPLIVLQFLAFGWRVHQEIRVSHAERQSVVSLPDVINIASLFATIGCTVVLPLATETYLWLPRMVLGGAYVLIAFYPLTIAAHYQLWKRKSISRGATEEASDHYANREELAISTFCIVIAVVVAAYLGKH